MKISGWGRRPLIEATAWRLQDDHQFKACLDSGFSGCAHGLGRSYGDSAVASQILDMRTYDHFLDFDDNSGVIACQAGVSLDEVLKVSVPKGWFLSVTPGTKFVTVGGCIASDVHGKNHHAVGCFSQFLLWLDLMLPNGDVIRCSKGENAEAFLATCGGMGLTGIILRAAIQLQPISSSYIDQETIKTTGLEHTLEMFEQTASADYSVAWIDCLAKGEQQGRCILTTGTHSTVGELDVHSAGKLSIPVDFPTITLNSLSIKAFNTLYYHKEQKDVSRAVVHYDPYFYPLDKLHNWNKMYGKNGFIQYQFVVPYEAGLKALRSALNAMAESGKASFLAVLKHLGAENNNYLSFPMEGYTLAVDFKWHPELPGLISVLNDIVLNYGGRIYLAKDGMMGAEMLRKTYPHLEQFIALRKQLNTKSVFNSLQSLRLKI